MSDVTYEVEQSPRDQAVEAVKTLAARTQAAEGLLDEVAAAIESRVSYPGLDGAGIVSLRLRVTPELAARLEVATGRPVLPATDEAAS